MKSLPRHVIPVSLVVAAAFGIALSSQSAGAQNPMPGTAPVNIVSPLPLPVNISNASPITVSGTIAVASNREAVQIGVECRVSPTLIGGADQAYTVPDGKRLTIEDVSIRVSTPIDQVVEARVSAGYTRYMSFSYQGRFDYGTGPRDVYIADGPVRIVATAGEIIRFECYRDVLKGDPFDPIVRFDGGFSGYLEDVAQ